MSRTLALPDADTPSYCPVESRSIMSSELAPSFVFTLQPVCCVNGFAHDGSAYPDQMTRLTCPSSRAFCWISSRLVPSPEICSALLPLPPPPPPQPAAAKARKTSSPESATPPSRCFQALLIDGPPLPPVRLRTCALGATRGGPACHGPRAPRRMLSPGSA